MEHNSCQWKIINWVCWDFGYFVSYLKYVREPWILIFIFQSSVGTSGDSSIFAMLLFYGF